MIFIFNVKFLTYKDNNKYNYIYKNVNPKQNPCHKRI